jgi:hypothetical protein
MDLVKTLLNLTLDRCGPQLADPSAATDTGNSRASAALKEDEEIQRRRHARERGVIAVRRIRLRQGTRAVGPPRAAVRPIQGAS